MTWACIKRLSRHITVELLMSDLVNHDFSPPLKTFLSSVLTLKKVYNTTLGAWVSIAADIIATLDSITIFGFLRT